MPVLRTDEEAADSIVPAHHCELAPPTSSSALTTFTRPSFSARNNSDGWSLMGCRIVSRRPSHTSSLTSTRGS
jgi:hypothetical protein